MDRNLKPNTKAKKARQFPKPTTVQRGAELFMALAKFYAEQPKKVQSYDELAAVLLEFDLVAQKVLRRFANVLVKRGTSKTLSSLTTFLADSKKQNLTTTQQAEKLAEIFGSDPAMLEQSNFVKSSRWINQPADTAANLVGDALGGQSGSNLKHKIGRAKTRIATAETIEAVFRAATPDLRMTLWISMLSQIAPKKETQAKKKASLVLGRKIGKQKRQNRAVGMARLYPDE